MRRKRRSDKATSRLRVSSSCRGVSRRTAGPARPAMAESDWDTVTVLRKKGPTAAQAKSKQVRALRRPPDPGVAGRTGRDRRGTDPEPGPRSGNRAGKGRGPGQERQPVRDSPGRTWVFVVKIGTESRTEDGRAIAGGVGDGMASWGWDRAGRWGYWSAGDRGGVDRDLAGMGAEGSGVFGPMIQAWGWRWGKIPRP